MMSTVSNWLPYISGGKIRAIGTDDRPVIDLGSWTADYVFQHKGDLVRAVLSEPMINSKRTVTGRAIRGGYLIPDDPDVLHIIIGHGQSLMTGARSAPTMISLENLWQRDALMLTCNESTDVRLGLNASSGTGSTAVLNPNNLRGFEAMGSAIGVGTGERGNTPMETAVHEICKAAREYEVQYRTVGFSVAKGSTAIASLGRGSLAHSNMLAAVTKTKTLAEARGWSVVVDCIFWKHGESDVNNVNYGAELTTLRGHIEEDLVAITEQASGVPMIVHQPSSHRVATPYSTLAMVDLHASAEPIYLAGSDYARGALYADDWTHFTGPGYVPMGMDFARAHNDLLWSPVGPQAVYITAGSRTGNTVTLSVDAAGGGLSFDTSTISERDAKGYTFEDSTGAIAITDATVTQSGASTGTGTVVLTLASTPSGVGERVLYGISPQNSSTPSLSDAPRGNLRTSSRWASHQIFDL